MPSSYTARNRLTKQATGENVNVWGNILNSGVFELVDFLSDGVVTISATGATALSTANGAADQARGRILNVTAATATITIPSVEKFYVVRSVGVTTLTNGANSVVLSAGEIGFIITDGTGIWKQALTDMAGQRLKNLGAPINTTDAATRKYVDDTAFAAAGGNLPGQSGNAGKFLQTDGAIPGWGLPTVEQIDGLAAAIAGAVTKTAVETAVGGPVALLNDVFVDISGATHTLTAADNGKLHRFTSATAVAVALPNSLPPGWNCLWSQIGAGQITFTAGSGATRRNANGHSKSSKQYAEGALRVDTNAGGAAAVYFLSGDTA